MLPSRMRTVPHPGNLHVCAALYITLLILPLNVYEHLLVISHDQVFVRAYAKQMFTHKICHTNQNTVLEMSNAVWV